MGMSGEQYRQQMSQLLPLGSAWARERDSILQRLLRGLSESLARVDLRADDLYRETDPQQTYELLERWERALGLPDECTVQGSMTVYERVRAVVAKLIHAGGQSRPYFIALAEALGYPDATITEFGPARFGMYFGSYFGGPDWYEVWRLNLPETQVIPMRFGRAAMGERLQVWGDAELECIVNKRKPGGSIALFGYGSKA
ncbi:MAG TPA: putative phage tail protein [Pseudomonas sp.]|uniref:YmfQ family protein n=1 Tax=Pseudomonas sp. TaxID=306 RepID=UPI002D0E710B|nr:putative phage tail protein [Pseudomonas sp.]HWH86365.1 putative phage tail protein [Pseudomonas sp.]